MIDEASLTKGQLRKLNALRKSVGPAIADEAFAKWLAQTVEVPEADGNAGIIANRFRLPDLLAFAVAVGVARTP